MTVPIPARDSDSGFASGAAFYKISWGAVLAGVAIALAAQFLLNLLGVGIGAGVLDPTTSDNPEASNFSIAGGIWFVLAGIVSAFIGGYIASRLSGRPDKNDWWVAWSDDLGCDHASRLIHVDHVSWRFDRRRVFRAFERYQRSRTNGYDRCGSKCPGDLQRNRSDGRNRTAGPRIDRK